MKNTDDVRIQGNGCEDEIHAPEIYFSDTATNDRWYAGQVGTSGPLYAMNIHSTVKPILPAETPTDTNALALYKQEVVKMSPHSHNNKNEGLAPDQDRRHLPLHDLLYVNNDHDATLHKHHSAGNAVGDMHLGDVQYEKYVASMTRLLAGYGSWAGLFSCCDMFALTTISKDDQPFRLNREKITKTAVDLWTRPDGPASALRDVWMARGLDPRRLDLDHRPPTLAGFATTSSTAAITRFIKRKKRRRAGSTPRGSRANE